MNCLRCGHEMVTKRENMPFTARPGAVLIGVPVSRCGACGEFEVAIPNIDSVIEMLANDVRFQSQEVELARLGALAVKLEELVAELRTKVRELEEDAARGYRGLQ